MKQVAILALQQALASSMTIPLEMIDAAEPAVTFLPKGNELLLNLVYADQADFLTD